MQGCRALQKLPVQVARVRKQPRQDALTPLYASPCALQAAEAGPGQLSPAQAAKELRKVASALAQCDIQLKLKTARERRVKDLIKAILCKEPRERLDPLALGSKGVADALWGMAVLGGSVAFMEETDSILGEVDFRTSLGGKGFSKDDIVDIIWALAKASHWTPKLEAATARLSRMGGLSALHPFKVCNLLWALATLDYAPPALLTRAPSQLRGKALNPKGLSITCWSLSVLQQYNTPLFRTLWDDLAGRWARGDLTLTPQLGAQVYQIVKTLELEGGVSRASWPVNQQELGTEAEQLWKARCRAVRKDLLRSRTHDEVTREMVGMGIAHTCEDISTGMQLDIAVPDLQVAIEIDGPHHFARNVGRPLGSTALKQRHLEAMGWAVFSVKMDDWENADSKKRRLQELRELILERRNMLGQQVMK